jgi:hypothetical protein
MTHSRGLSHRGLASYDLGYEYSQQHYGSLQRVGEDTSQSKMERAMNFEQWTNELRSDCIRLGKPEKFTSLGDYVLQVLWEANIEPSVRAISGDGELTDAPVNDTSPRR